jgi:hypothetical protein
MPMVSIDISEAGFEQRTRHLSDDGSIRSRSRPFSLAVSAGNLANDHRPRRAPLR